MTFSHSAHQWCNKKPGETVTQFLKKKKVGFDPKPTSMHLKNDGSRQSLPLPFSSQWFTNKNYKKKSFQKKEGGGEQKHEKKGRECCLIQFISELCLPFPFFIAGFLSSSASQHRFSGFRFLTEPTDLTILSKDFSPILFNCEAEVDEGFPSIVTRWKRNGQFLQFPDFNGRRYVVIILSRFNSELFPHNPTFFTSLWKFQAPLKLQWMVLLKLKGTKKVYIFIV